MSATGCDVCGAAATHCSRDAVEIPSADGKYRSYRPGDEIRRGCDLHPAARPRELLLDGRIINTPRSSFEFHADRSWRV